MKKSKTPSTWDLSPLVNDSDTEASQLKRAKTHVEQFCSKWSQDSSYLKDPSKLKRALDEYENLMHTTGIDGNVGYFYSLKSALVSEDGEIKSGLSRATKHAQEMWNMLQFFTLKISKIDSQLQRALLEDPDLLKYKHALESLFEEGAHTLSEAEERVMMMKSTTSYGNWAQLLPQLLSGETCELTTKKGTDPKPQSFEQIMNLMNNKDKSIRDSAAQAFNSLMQKYEQIAERELNSILEHKRVDDLLRNYKRPDSSRLVADDVDAAVVDALVEAVSSSNDIAHTFYTKKAAMLGLPILAYHERNLDVARIEKTYSYDEATCLVHDVFNKLDPAFDAIYTRLLANGQVDVFPKKGKRGGAFCAHDMLTNPTYVLLNFTDSLRDVTTIAHEMGHAINNELIRESGVHALYFGTPTSTAEVASTFMEDFVYEEVSKDVDDEGRRAIAMSRLNDDISTIWRQVACYRFERALHDEYRRVGYVPSGRIGELFQVHMSAYMGSSVEQSPGSERWWIYWSHIRSYFYNYSYAFGLLISKIMQTRVRQDKAYISQVKKFLSVGTSTSPKEILSSIGIDVTNPSTWKEGIGYVSETLKNLP